MKLVSIITVNYNNAAITECLLHSILKKNLYTNIEVIVIDNASKTDPTVQWINQYPNFKFIRSNINLGFAGGNNLGLSMAKGDYFFFINNDTEITDTTILNLVAQMDSNSAIGIISPKILYFDQHQVIQYAGYTKMNYKTGRNSCIGQYEKDLAQYDHLTGETGYAHGAAMMLSRKAVDNAGAMAENFFLYYEELDWCERIKKAGFQVWVNMQAIVYHKESMSVGKKSALKEYYMNRNRMLFIRKHASYFDRLVFINYFTLVVIPRNIIYYIKDKQMQFIPILLKSVWWNLTHNVNSKYKPL